MKTFRLYFSHLSAREKDSLWYYETRGRFCPLLEWNA